MNTMVSRGPMETLLRWLDDKRIDYQIHEHERSLTALATARSEGVDPRTFEKVIWVRATEGRDALVVVDAEDHLDLGKARRLLGTRKVRLVDEDEIATLAPECDRGAMPAVGILFGLPTYADLAVADEPRISFDAGSHAHAVRVDRAGWEAALGVVYGDLAADVEHELPSHRG